MFARSTYRYYGKVQIKATHRWIKHALLKTSHTRKSTLWIILKKFTPTKYVSYFDKIEECNLEYFVQKPTRQLGLILTLVIKTGIHVFDLKLALTLMSLRLKRICNSVHPKAVAIILLYWRPMDVYSLMVNFVWSPIIFNLVDSVTCSHFSVDPTW